MYLNIDELLLTYLDIQLHYTLGQIFYGLGVDGKRVFQVRDSIVGGPPNETIAIHICVFNMAFVFCLEHYCDDIFITKYATLRSTLCFLSILDLIYAQNRSACLQNALHANICSK